MERIDPRVDVGGRDYREMTPHEYSAEIYKVIDAYAPGLGIPPEMVDALKISIFVESSGIYDNRPGYRIYDEASKKEFLTKTPDAEFVLKPNSNDNYYRIVTRHDELGEPYQDYARMTSAFGASQNIERTRNALTGMLGDLYGHELPESHPYNQAMLITYGLYENMQNLPREMRGAEGEGIDPFKAMGAGFAYMTHKAGISTAAEAAVAFHRDPDTPLTNVYSSAAIEGNKQIRLPAQINSEQPTFGKWTVGEYRSWIYDKLTRPDIVEATAMAEQINNPNIPLEELQSRFRESVKSSVDVYAAHAPEGSLRPQLRGGNEPVLLAEQKPLAEQERAEEPTIKQASSIEQPNSLGHLLMKALHSWEDSMTNSDLALRDALPAQQMAAMKVYSPQLSAIVNGDNPHIMGALSELKGSDIAAIGIIGETSGGLHVNLLNFNSDITDAAGKLAAANCVMDKAQGYAVGASPSVVSEREDAKDLFIHVEGELDLTDCTLEDVQAPNTQAQRSPSSLLQQTRQS